MRHEHHQPTKSAGCSQHGGRVPGHDRGSYTNHAGGTGGDTTCCLGSDQQAAASAKDPVCGMSVDPHSAKHRAEHNGHPFYFCSAGCRTKFLADPNGTSTRPEAKAAPVPGGHGLYLPDAPRGRADRAGLVPVLRHGA
jgi:Cu+-exporting ATPase